MTVLLFYPIELLKVFTLSCFTIDCLYRHSSMAVDHTMGAIVAPYVGLKVIKGLFKLRLKKKTNKLDLVSYCAK